jgi:ketosteroid isomerase-like protein
VKADSQTQAEVALTLKAMFEAYAKRDLNGVLSFWAPDPDAVIIGSGGDEKCEGINQFVRNLRRDWEQSDSVTIEPKDVAVSMAGSVAWFVTDIIFHGKIGVDNFAYPCRLTGVLEKRDGNWLFMQLHFSVPSAQQEHGQSWPKPQSST